MTGAREVTIPHLGRRLTLKADGAAWEIAPSWGAVLRVAAALKAAGHPGTGPLEPHHEAAIADAVVEHFLTLDQKAQMLGPVVNKETGQRDSARGWPTERQGFAVGELAAFWIELRTGRRLASEDPGAVGATGGPDPTSTPAASPAPVGGA